MADSAESDEWADQRRLKAEAREARRAFRSGPEHGLAHSLRTAMTDYQQMRGQGVSQEDACRGIETILRDVFPQTKFPPRCEVCADTGWEEQVCDDGHRCGRRWCAHTEETYTHPYVQPCVCPSGDTVRQRPADAAVIAGRTTRRKSHWTRVGG
jgi:hypothetical protein